MSERHERDESRSVTCPTCGSVNVPLRGEPDITFCLKAECGAIIEAQP